MENPDGSIAQPIPVPPMWSCQPARYNDDNDDDDDDDDDHHGDRDDDESVSDNGGHDS